MSCKNNNTIKAVFLIRTYVPHQVISINSLIDVYGVDVTVFSISKTHKYIPERREGFTPYLFSDLGEDKTYEKIKEIKPDILVAAGWMTPEYNQICKKVKSSTNIPVVAMTDTPWYGTWKQKLNAIIAPFYTKKMFTHIWVAGIRQYDYARKLGFKNNQIIFNSLSADVELFNKTDIEKKVTNYPKKFLYIGRYTKVKGLHNLIDAWESIEDKKGWTFTLIGAGELKDELVKVDGFDVKDYMTHNELLGEMENSGCFVLPSTFESWALVIHEAAAAGLPVLATETCGAAPHFIINGYNGYRIKDNSVEDLKSKLSEIIEMSDKDLLDFAKKSKDLSLSINSKVQAASLMQIIYASKN